MSASTYPGASDSQMGPHHSAPISSSSNGTSSTSSSISRARVSPGVRSMQLAMLPARIVSLKKQISIISKEQDQLSAQRKFTEASALGEKVSSLQVQLSLRMREQLTFQNAEAKARKQRNKRFRGDDVDQSAELAASSYSSDENISESIEKQGGLRQALGERWEEIAGEHNSDESEALLKLMESCEILMSHRELRSSRNREDQMIRVPKGTNEGVILRVSPVFNLDLDKYIPAAEALCLVLGHRGTCRCKTVLDVAAVVRDADKSGRCIGLQDAWKMVHDGRGAKDAQLVSTGVIVPFPVTKHSL
jgi:hypothetical protein